MTLLQLLNNEKVNWVQVNIIKQINTTNYIVGDASCVSIMTIPEDSGYEKYVEVGKGIKLVKPQRIAEKHISCHPKFSPMKSRPQKININQVEVETLASSVIIKPPRSNETSFSKINTDYDYNTVINTVVMYVTSKLKIINGKYINYQICNLKDCEGGSGTINLYKYNIDKLEISKIYKIERIKKTAIKSDHGPRLATTNFTKITDVTEAKAAVFAHVQLGDKRIKGECILFSDLLCYKA